MNILLVKKYHPLIKVERYKKLSLLILLYEKLWKNETKKPVDALGSLNLSNKIDKWKQTETIFPQNQLNDLIIDELKEIKQLQDNIKLDNLEYTTKIEKIMVSLNTLTYIFKEM